MVSDDQVWAAYEAARKEGGRWRVMEWKGQGAIAVRDRFSTADLPDYTEAQEMAFERIDFKDGDTAQKYIEWRAIKAALETVNP